MESEQILEIFVHEFINIFRTVTYDVDAQMASKLWQRWTAVFFKWPHCQFVLYLWAAIGRQVLLGYTILYQWLIGRGLNKD